MYWSFRWRELILFMEEASMIQVTASKGGVVAVAAVALEMASEAESEPGGEELTRLAAKLMTVERRSRALNLYSRGQMVSCLMRWYREL